MKISPAKAVSFIAAPPKTIFAIVVFGPDRGLSDSRLFELADKYTDDISDPFSVSHVDGATLRSSPEKFWDEITAQSLTGRRRIVLLRNAVDAQADDIKRFVEGDVGLHSPMLLVQAGELSPRSKLRKLAETAENAAALACYPLDGNALAQFIQANLAAQDITIERPAVEYLSHTLAENHGLRMSELVKLALYAGPGGNLTYEDVATCIVATAETGQGELALAVAAGNLEQLERLAARAWRDGTSPVSVLRSVVIHFQRLYRAASSMKSGANLDRAMAGLRPPVFWKHKQQFGAQLNIWGVSDLQAVIGHLVIAEIGLKSTGIPSEASCHRELLAIAQRARKRSRRRT